MQTNIHHQAVTAVGLLTCGGYGGGWPGGFLSRVEVWDLTCHTCLAIIQVEDTTPTPDSTTHSTLVHYTTQYI